LNKPKEAEEVRQNVLNLLSARVLAGKKMTAQEIADQLDITIEEAQIAVLSPIGDEIQIAAPDLSRLSQNGVKEAAVIAIPLGIFIIIGGGIILYIYVNNGDTIVTATDKSGREIWRRTGDAAQDLAHKYFPGIFPAKASKQNKKDRATDIPSWAKGQKPNPGESGKDFAKRLLDKKYGSGSWKKDPGTEYNQLRKYGDRGF
jgi:hypothetical protein